MRAVVADDHVRRDFNPPAPRVTRYGESRTCTPGVFYLATVIDLYSRRVIGWAAADHVRSELVVEALTMAVATRGGHVAGVVFLSD